MFASAALYSVCTSLSCGLFDLGVYAGLAGLAAAVVLAVNSLLFKFACRFVRRIGIGCAAFVRLVSGFYRVSAVMQDALHDLKNLGVTEVATEKTIAGRIVEKARGGVASVVIAGASIVGMGTSSTEAQAQALGETTAQCQARIIATYDTKIAEQASKGE